MKKILWSIFAFVLLISGCDRLTGKKESSDDKERTVRTVYTHSIGDMEKAFDDSNYSLGKWDADRRVIPRVYLTDISSRWGEQVQRLPVKMKKSIFFQMILPLVLHSNEELLRQRKKLEGLAKKKSLSVEESTWLRKTARQYKLLKGDEKIDKSVIDELLLRVNIIPPSLALAQAAKESGWGTSRFSLLGNSLFGQWDLSGNGMVPAQQRKELGTYGLASFETPLLAVKSYMANLNTHPAYRMFRALRARQIAEGGDLDGMALAGTLDRYSERGQAYVDDLRSMMKYNRLTQTDKATLSDDETIFITPIADPKEIVDARMKKLLSAAKTTNKRKRALSPSARLTKTAEKNTSLRLDTPTLRDETNATKRLESEGKGEPLPHPKREGAPSKESASQTSTVFEGNDTDERIPWEWESNMSILPWSLSDDLVTEPRSTLSEGQAQSLPEIDRP